MNDVRNSIFDKYCKYKRTLLVDISAKENKKDIFKPATGNANLNEIDNDNGIRTVYFATFKSTLFPHHNINLLGRLLI